METRSLTSTRPNTSWRRDAARSRGVEVSSEQVAVTFFTILALVDEGDEVSLPNPDSPIYESPKVNMEYLPGRGRLLRTRS